MINATDQPEPAHFTQLAAIDFKLMIARISDQQLNDLKIKLNNGLTVDEADQVLVWLDQGIDRDWTSAKFINDRITKKLGDSFQ